MAKKKSSSSSASSELESSVSPILEITYKDPLFSLAAHPSRPIFISGLATGHLYCDTYDAEKLEEKASERREKLSLIEKEAFKKGTSGTIVKSVSQLKTKWWTIIKDNTEIPEDSHLVTNWKTKRHKGSCRSVLFDPLENTVGENLYSVGTDHIIKKASTETGKVLSKTTVSDHYEGSEDAITKLSHSTTNPFLLAGTENGHVLIYDSKNLSTSQLKFKVSEAHEDSINDILPMPAISAYHYLTLGSTTLSHIDIRKGIITQSDDQSDELLSMCFATDHINENKNDTALVAHGEGIVTIWKDSKNKFRDQLSRIKINKNASVDAIIPTMNYDTDDLRDSVWCGDSEGLLHRVNYKKGRVVETRVHSNTIGKYGAADEVGILDIDYEYRLISAGMDSMKIWSANNYAESEKSDSDEDSDINDDDDDSDSDSDSDIDGNDGEHGNKLKAALENKSEDDNDQWEDILSNEEDQEEGSSSLAPSDLSGSDVGSDLEDELSEEEEMDISEKVEEEHKPATLDIIRKKRFDISKMKPKKTIIDINKLTKKSQKAEVGHDTEEEEPTKKKQKVKQISAKQLKNAQQHEPGIRRFEGL